jgi:hypothetical protein
LLALTRREAPRRTTLFVGSEDTSDWHAVAAPNPVHALAAEGERWWLCTEDALHASGDRGRTFESLPLPEPWPYHTMAIGPRGPWIGANDRVLGLEAGAWSAEWTLPPAAQGLQIGDLVAMGDEFLALTTGGRIFLGRPGQGALESYSDGLPPLTPPMRGAATVSVVDEWLFAFWGELFWRRRDDAAWRAARQGAPQELQGVVQSGSADWKRTPWDAGTWIGQDGLSLLESGPGKPLVRRWQSPQRGLHGLRPSTPCN